MLSPWSLGRRCAGLLVAAVLAAQAPPAPARPELGTPAPLPEGAPPAMATIERQTLAAHAYWLADDARGGRLTGSAGQQATAKYVAEQLQKLGLKPLGDKRGFLQTYPLVRFQLEPGTGLFFGAEKIVTGFGVFVASDNDKINLAGRFAFCGGGRTEELPADLKGRIPVVAVSKPPRGGGAGADIQASQFYADLARRLHHAGAAAMVVGLLVDDTPLANTISYGGLRPEGAAIKFAGSGGPKTMPLPMLVLPAATTQKLLLHLQVPLDDEGLPTGTPKEEKATGRLSIGVHIDSKGSASNVVAVLEGRDRKQEAVVFSAHHDHVGTRLDGKVFHGADDNASGTSGLLMIAAAFAKGSRPQRSVVFLSVSGEEYGLFGSKFFADNPTWPLPQIVADINVDMIGRAGAEHPAMQITPSFAHEKFNTLARAAARLADVMHVSISSGDQYFARSDHYNFAQKNVPVVFLCDGEHPDYHQVTDSADKLNYASMETVARLAFWLGNDLANQKDRPQELGKQSGW